MTTAPEPIKLASFTLYIMPDGNLLSDIETIPVDHFKQTMQDFGMYEGGNKAVNALEFVNNEFDAVRDNLEQHLRNI